MTGVGLASAGNAARPAPALAAALPHDVASAIDELRAALPAGTLRIDITLALPAAADSDAVARAWRIQVTGEHGRFVAARRTDTGLSVSLELPAASTFVFRNPGHFADSLTGFTVRPLPHA